jgi:predicted phage tail protein
MKAAQTARGNLFKKGNKYSVWVDKAASHVQLFGEGNSTNVSINPIPRADRANILTTSFLDAATNYDQKDISVEDVQGSEYPIVKNIPVQVGVTRENQVTALLQYMLLQNRYVSSAISLDAGIDSLEVTLGDAFIVASQAKDFALSGRLVDTPAPGTTVILDQPFTPEAGITYQLTVWSTDGTLYTWSGTLTGTAITSIPAPTGLIQGEYYEHPYVLAKVTEERMKYRCIGVRRSADTMHANVSGIEYRSEVYAND